MDKIIIYVLLAIIVLLAAVIVELMLVSASAKDRWYMEGYINGAKKAAADREEDDRK